MANPADGEAFAAEVKEIWGLYEEAPALEKSGVELVRVDEKTGIQALERAAETRTDAMWRGGKTRVGRHSARGKVFNREG